MSITKDEYVKQLTDAVIRKKEIDNELLKLQIEKKQLLQKIKELRKQSYSTYWKYINNHMDHYFKRKITQSTLTYHSEYNDQQNLSDE
jgi:ribonuclease HI